MRAFSMNIPPRGNIIPTFLCNFAVEEEMASNFPDIVIAHIARVIREEKMFSE
jgi:hypothetical protein